MKKIMFLLAAVVSLAVVYSCSDDDDNPYYHPSSISVDSTSVVFQAAASTGFITVKAPNGITDVRSSAAWCTASYSGSVVSLAATQNDDLEGRTAQITIYSGSDSTQVTVQQMGFIFAIETGSTDNSVVAGDDAVSYAFHMKHNAEIQLSSAADWIMPTVDGDSLRISVAENTTGNPREGYVYYSSGTYRDSIRVTQFDIDKDVLGDYNLNYYGSNGNESSYAMNLYRRSDGSYALKFTTGSYASSGLEIPVTLGTDYPRITITNLDNVGMYTYRDVEYHVIALVMYTNGTSNYTHPSNELQAVGTWYQEDGYNYYSFDVSNYLGSGYDFYAIRLRLSTDGTYSGGTSNLRTMYWAELEKTSSAD